MKKQKKRQFKTRTIGYGITITSFVWSIISFALGKYQNDIPSVAWYGFFLFLSAIVIICMVIIDKKNIDINYYQESLRDETSGLIESYSQLAEVEKDKKYLNFFHQFVRYEEYVLGVQTYNYYLSSKDGKSGIKIEYENGYIEENKDINAIIQAYYNFKKRDIVSLRKAIYRFRLTNDLSRLQDFFFTKANPIFQNKISPEDYALISLSGQELSEALNVDYGYLPFQDDELVSKKRLGIAKAILTYEYFNLSTYFGFSYRGKSKLKDTRRYLSYIVESKTGTKKLYLIIYQTEQYHTENDIMNLEEQIIVSFKNLLSANGLVTGSEGLDDKKRSDLHEFIQKIKQNF